MFGFFAQSSFLHTYSNIAIVYRRREEDRLPFLAGGVGAALGDFFLAFPGVFFPFLDLGVSSSSSDTSGAGFSFSAAFVGMGPLDLGASSLAGLVELFLPLALPGLLRFRGGVRARPDRDAVGRGL